MKSERTLTAYLVVAFVSTFCCCNVNSSESMLPNLAAGVGNVNNDVINC